MTLAGSAACAAAALALGAAVGFGVEALAAIPVALIGLPFLLLRPERLIYVLSLWVPLQYWFTKDLEILPVAFVWLDELFVVLLGGVTLAFHVARRSYRPTPLDVPLIVFLGVALLSAVGNGVRPIVAVLGLRDIFQYAIVFYALAMLPLRASWDRRWIAIAFAIGALQAPLAIVQTRSFFLTQQHRIAAGDYDVMIGTFGPSGGDFVAYFLTFLLLIVFARVRSGGTRWLWLVPSLLVTFVFSTSRLCFLFLPLGVLWLYRDQIRARPSSLALPGALVAAAFGGLVVYYWNDPQVMRMVLDPMLVVRSQLWVDASYVGRMIHYPIAAMILRDMSVSPFLGVGPGMYLGPTASFFMVPITEMFYGMFRLDPTELRFGSVDSGILEILVPYGLLGFGAFAFLVARFHAIGRALERGARSIVSRDYGAAFRAMVLFMVFGSLAAPVWEVQILAFYFWLFAGIAYRTARREGVMA